MLMKGDINKVIQEVNKVLEGAFERIQALEDRIMAIEGVPSKDPVDNSVMPDVPKRGPGRPPGSKNKLNKIAA